MKGSVNVIIGGDVKKIDLTRYFFYDVRSLERLIEHVHGLDRFSVTFLNFA